MDIQETSPEPSEARHVWHSRPSIKQSLDPILSEHEHVELEVGSGKGLFLIQAAKQNPSTFFVGLEIAAKYAHQAQEKVERQKLVNARFFCADAMQVMAEEVPTNRLKAVHCYFPDPWWKKRHKKRRVLNERMIENIERVIRPGGEFHFWTDVLDYFESTLELIAAHSKLVGPIHVPEPESSHDLDYRTHFERRTRGLSWHAVDRRFGDVIDDHRARALCRLGNGCRTRERPRWERFTSE